MVKLVEERASNELSIALIWLDRMKILVERNDDLAVGRDEIQHLLDSLQPGRAALVADAAGGVAFLSAEDQPVFDISGRDYFQKHAKGMRTYVGPILLAHPTGQPIMTVSVRLDEPDGSFRGIVAMSLDPIDLLRFWRSLDMGPGGIVEIKRPDGSNVASDRMVASDDKSADMPMNTHLQRTPHGVWDAICPVDGIHRIIAHQTFRSLPLVAVVGIATKEVVADWGRRQIRVLGAALPLLGLVVGLALWTQTAFRRERVAHAAMVSTLSERELLLAEVHHRVKNNLQIIQSLLTMEFLTASPEMRSGYDKSLQRIQAMGMVHELLYTSGDFGRVSCKEYVERLGALLLGEEGAISLTVEGDDARLDLDRAVPFAMAVNEILSNTLKHAFPNGRFGRVAIHLSHRNGTMALSVADDGIGMPAGFDPARSGNMGARLLMGLARQLDGTVTFESLAGTVVRLEFPLEL